MPASADFFKKYINNYFIETGSYRGDGIQNAINSGFKNIISVELFEENYKHCVNRFKNQKFVKLYHGSSSDLLYEMMKDIKDNATIWLDAHYSGKNTAKTEEKYFSPILMEIRELAKHPNNKHTILIDDRRDFGTVNFDYVKEDKIVEEIKKINKDYKISYDTGNFSNPLFKNDILVAHV